MTRVQAVYAFWVLLILFILSILVVSGVLWTEYETVAWYYMVGAGLGALYLASAAMASSSSLDNFFNRMGNAFADIVAK